MPEKIEGIVEKAKAGDEESFSKLITMFKKLVFTIIYRMTNDYDLSLDLCQDTFINCFRNISKLKKPGKFKSWLCKIAINLSRDELKKRKREGSIQKYKRENGFAFDNGLSKRTIIINEALGKLKTREREILILYYYKGMAIKEIEELTGLKEGNLKVVLSRARINLRKKLEGYEYELLS